MNINMISQCIIFAKERNSQRKTASVVANLFFHIFEKDASGEKKPCDCSAKELIKYALSFFVLVVTVSLSHSCRSVAVLSIEIKLQSCSAHTLS